VQELPGSGFADHARLSVGGPSQLGDFVRIELDGHPRRGRATRDPEGLRQPLPSVTGAVFPASFADTCWIEYYYDDSATAFWGWQITSSSLNSHFATRFTAEPGYVCSLEVVRILVLGYSKLGTPDMRVYVWSDDGTGLPGQVLDSVDIPYEVLPSSADWVEADFSIFGRAFVDGEDFHIGWTMIGGPGDRLVCLRNDHEAGLLNGAICTDEFWNNFSIRSGKKINEELFGKFFSPRLDQGVMEIIAQLKSHSRVVCGTNTFDPHYDYLLAHGYYRVFDAVYASNKMGMSKPDPDFYRYILNDEGIKPEDALFVDDFEENVSAAEKLRIKSILFTDAHSLGRQIQRIQASG